MVTFRLIDFKLVDFLYDDAYFQRSCGAPGALALNGHYYAPVKLAGQFAHPRCTNRVINHSSCFVVKTLPS